MVRMHKRAPGKTLDISSMHFGYHMKYSIRKIEENPNPKTSKFGTLPSCTWLYACFLLALMT